MKEFAHARFDAVKRCYYYFLSQKRDPFRDAYTWYVYGDLDFELMNQAAAKLIGQADFSSFSKSNTQVKTNICTIQKAVWHKSAEGEWRFTIVADRFLRGMVRAVVGTLVMVGKSKMTIQEFSSLIDAKDRQRAGSNAPANALFLSGITYSPEIYID